MRTRLPATVLGMCLVAASPGCSGGEAPQPSGEAIEPPQITGLAPSAVRGFPSVVTFQPLEEGAHTPPPADTPSADTLVMDQIHLQFFPGFLVLRPGQTVEFRNSETDAAHNVRVEHLPGDSMIFNTGVAQGIPYRYAFEALGGYHVTCDIHSGMDAAFLVTDAPYYAVAGDDGAFSLPRLPAGSYAVDVWSMDAGVRSTHKVTVSSAPLQIDLQRQD